MGIFDHAGPSYGSRHRSLEEIGDGPFSIELANEIMNRKIAEAERKYNRQPKVNNSPFKEVYCDPNDCTQNDKTIEILYGKDGCRGRITITRDDERKVNIVNHLGNIREVPIDEHLKFFDV